MAASPQWKVYDSAKKYQAACHDIEAAAILVTFYADNDESPGATIRLGHGLIVWTEGPAHLGYDGRAADSYDEVAERAENRIRAAGITRGK